MKLYEDPNAKVEDMKSTAWSFTIIAVLGLILILCVDLGVIPVSMTDDMKIIMTVVMSVLFLFFLYTGVRAFLSLRSIQNSAARETDLTSEIIEWFLSHHKEELQTMDCSSHEEEQEPEQIYFPRYERISALITEEYPDLSEEFLDHLAEELYGKLFPENP